MVCSSLVWRRHHSLWRPTQVKRLTSFPTGVMCVHHERRRRGLDLEKLVHLYLKACAVEGNTERTVQSYGETLGQFQRACGEIDLPQDVSLFTAAHVYLFLAWVVDRGVGSGT